MSKTSSSTNRSLNHETSWLSTSNTFSVTIDRTFGQNGTCTEFNHRATAETAGGYLIDQLIKKPQLRVEVGHVVYT